MLAADISAIFTCMKKYKILIFDLDDTLIDNKESVRAAFKAMVAFCGEDYTENNFDRWYALDKKFWLDWQDGLIQIPDELKQETGKKSEKYLDWVRAQRFLLYFGQSISLERAIELKDVFTAALTESVYPINGALRTLKYLAGEYTIIIATNGPGAATETKLEKIGCREFVTEVLSADMFGFMKPKVEFFEAIEQRYKDFCRDDYLIIGDSLKSDVGFGMNAGIDSCWFNKNNEKLDGIHKPTYTIKHLSELISIV